MKSKKTSIKEVPLAALAEETRNTKTKKAIFQRLSLPKLEGAIFISGEWGVGKTHFLRHILKEYVGQESNKPDKDGLKTYIVEQSLFGMASLEAIYQSISAEIVSQYTILPNGLRTVLRLGGSIVGLIAPAIKAGCDAAKEGFDKLCIDNSKKQQIILVFDDFERSTLPTQELLGCISQYIEQPNFKVIVVCNDASFLSEKAESNPAEDQTDTSKAKDDSSTDQSRKKTAYQMFKEKVFAAQFKVYPEVEMALDTFLSDQKNVDEYSDACACLEKYKSDILNAFQNDNIENLRHLRRFVSDFSLIFNNFTKEMCKNDDFIRKMLLSILNFSKLVHSGEFTPSQLFGRPPKNYYEQLEKKMSALMPPTYSSTKSDYEQVKEKMSALKLGTYPFYRPLKRFWLVFYEDGFVDSTALQEGYDIVHNSVKLPKPWLIDLNNCTQEEFDKAHFKLNSMISNKEMISLGNIADSAFHYCIWSECRVVPESVEEIEDKYLNMFDEIKKNKIEIDYTTISLEDEHLPSFEGLSDEFANRLKGFGVQLEINAYKKIILQFLTSENVNDFKVNWRGMVKSKSLVTAFQEIETSKIADYFEELAKTTHSTELLFALIPIQDNWGGRGSDLLSWFMGLLEKMKRKELTMQERSLQRWRMSVLFNELAKKLDKTIVDEMVNRIKNSL